LSTRHNDLSADGTRFLMLKLPGALGVVPNVIVVQHFNEELKRLVPAN